MIGLIVTLLQILVNILKALLPASPFQDLANNALTQYDAVQKGLAWLNWFVPIGEFLTLMSVWLAALIALYIARFFYSTATTIVKKAG